MINHLIYHLITWLDIQWDLSMNIMTINVTNIKIMFVELNDKDT